MTFGLPAGPIVNSLNVQNATRYSTAMFYAAADGVRSGGNRQWRIWLGGDTVDAGEPDATVEMTRAPEHGTLWATYPEPGAPETVLYRRSFDRADTWTVGDVHTGDTSHRSLSINWYLGRLWIVWQDDMGICQTNSRDLGNTWSEPMVLSLMGSNPRHLVDPVHGVSFYFYLVGGDLKLKRSGDFGVTFIDTAEIAVVGGVGNQTVAAQFGPDHSLVVGYIDGGAWTQVRSRDYGRTWA